MDDIFATYTSTYGRYDNGIYKGNPFRLTPDKEYFNPDDRNPAIEKEEGFLVAPLQFGQYQNGYAVADLRLTYTPDHAHWTIGAFCTNLTNTEFLKDNGNTGLELGLPTVIPGEPRFYGVTFTIRK